MSRLWPHSAYAEDQPYSRTILATHVLYRGFQAGAIGGSMFGPVWYYLRGSAAAGPLLPAILRSSGAGAVIGTGLITVALSARMWNREEIEWKDRSWRLLENKGQLEVDTWSVSGAVLGAAALAVLPKGASNGLGWKMVTGSIGIGSTVGIVGYLGWRYGVHGGQFPK